MADLADPRVVFELALRARAETLVHVPVHADPRTYSQQAEELYDYHVRLLALMDADLGDDPGEAEQAAHDAQARKVEDASASGKRRGSARGAPRSGRTEGAVTAKAGRRPLVGCSPAFCLVVMGAAWGGS